MEQSTNIEPLWRPDKELLRTSRAALFMKANGHATYSSLWQWSVDEPAAFWPAVWKFCGVVGDVGGRVFQNGTAMSGTRWFPHTRLNYAENLLARGDDANPALVFRGEDKVHHRLTRGELREEVARFARFLREAGVTHGDRVAGYLPNLPENIVAMLATASLGAVWSSVSPDFGVQGVLDRFGQIEPKVLVCVDGYWYNGKAVDCRAKNAEVAACLPSLVRTVIVPYLGETLADASTVEVISNAETWTQALGAANVPRLVFERVAFDHPLLIHFSSGTAGVPKCIVHGHGGVLLQHLKEHQLHADVRPGDRLFYYTTCGWMMWNWLASGLASGATLLLYDGSAFAAGRDGVAGTLLFDYAEDEAMTHFGTSAKFIDAIAKAELCPRASHRLDALRVVLSTGSPLSPEGFDYVYREIKDDVLLASIAGGTDIASCFVPGSPLLPV